MNVSRRDVVLVVFPYPSGTGNKVRPALVIQNDLDNGRLLNTIVVQITSVTRRAREMTQVLVDIATPEGTQTGLLFDSVVNCANVATVDKSLVLRKLGEMPDVLMRQVELAIDAALALP